VSTILKNFFKTKHPKKRYLYAITGGVYLGEMFVFMETDSLSKDYIFLSLPDLLVRSVSKEKFNFGLENKIVDIVKKLPNDVYDVCRRQYLKNQSTNTVEKQ